MSGKTNKQLAFEKNCTARQIAKSRKRGWITTEGGQRVKFTAPSPVYRVTSKQFEQYKKRNKK